MELSQSNWTLWTIWSKTILNEVRKEEVTGEDLTNFIIDLIKQQDKSFDNVILSSDIVVIQPTNRRFKNKSNNTNDCDVENASASQNYLEIVGTLFQPGEKTQEGNTWTVSFTNEMALLLASDKSFSSSELLIVVGGSVDHSTHQISLNFTTQQRIIIIRFIGDVSGSPEIKEIGSIRSFKIPYRTNIPGTVNIFKRPRNNSIILKTFPRNCINNYITNDDAPSDAQRTTLKLCSKRGLVSSTTVSSSSSQRNALNPLIPLSSTTSKIQKLQSSSSFVENTTKLINSNIETRLINNNQMDGIREPLTNQNNNNENAKGGGGGFFPESDNEDEEDNDQMDIDGGSSNTTRKIIRLQTKENDNYKYYKLDELEKQLLENGTQNWNSNVLEHANIWAVVDEVIQAPTETEFKEQRFMHKTFTYLLRVSDEKKRNVLVRLCTVKRLNNRKFNSIHEIGPMMKPLDIIRIHRATVQAESVGGVKEMVISTTPHLNYTLFNHDPLVYGPIIHQRLAKKTEALHSGDEATIKYLRCFSIYRNDKPDSNTSGPILSSESSGNSQANQQNNKNDNSNLNNKTSPVEMNERQHDSSNSLSGEVRNEPPAVPDNNSERNEDCTIPKVCSTNNASHNEMSERVVELEHLNEDHSEPVLSQELRINQPQNVTNTDGILQLQDISFNLDTTFSISGRLCDMIQLPEDELVIRISDGTKLRVLVKNIIQNESPMESDFVDVQIQNLSANPYILDDIQMRLGSCESVVFSSIRANEVTENGKKMIQLSSHSSNFLIQ